MKKDSETKIISNVEISNQCYKELKHMSIDMEKGIREVAAYVIEKYIFKKQSKQEIIQCNESK